MQVWTWRKGTYVQNEKENDELMDHFTVQPVQLWGYNGRMIPQAEMNPTSLFNKNYETWRTN